MIYEVRTYNLQPGSVPAFEESFANALPHREKYSKLAAFWHTDIGPLNPIRFKSDAENPFCCSNSRMAISKQFSIRGVSVLADIRL